MNKSDRLGLRGYFEVEHYRKGKLIGTHRTPNDIVDVGMNSILDTMFNGTPAQVSTWYMGIMNSSATEAAGDTMASHSGWTEYTGYTGTDRILWDAGSAAARAITNASTTDFTIGGTVTLDGIFINDKEAHSNNTGLLWSTAKFTSPVSAVLNDVLKVTYTITGA